MFDAISSIRGGPKSEAMNKNEDMVSSEAPSSFPPQLKVGLARGLDMLIPSKTPRFDDKQGGGCPVLLVE